MSRTHHVASRALLIAALLISLLSACDRAQDAAPTSAQPKAQAQPLAGAAQAPAPPSTSCEPLKAAPKAMHEELSCLGQGIPHDRLVVINSRATIKGLVSQAEAKLGTSCPVPLINFNEHELIAFHAQGPCEIRVEDSFCGGDKPRYKATIYNTTGCTHYGTSARFWLIPKLPDGQAMALELERKAEP